MRPAGAERSRMDWELERHLVAPRPGGKVEVERDGARGVAEARRARSSAEEARPRARSSVIGPPSKGAAPNPRGRTARNDSPRRRPRRRPMPSHCRASDPATPPGPFRNCVGGLTWKGRDRQERASRAAAARANCRTRYRTSSDESAWRPGGKRGDRRAAARRAPVDGAGSAGRRAPATARSTTSLQAKQLSVEEEERLDGERVLATARRRRPLPASAFSVSPSAPTTVQYDCSPEKDRGYASARRLAGDAPRRTRSAIADQASGSDDDLADRRSPFAAGPAIVSRTYRDSDSGRRDRRARRCPLRRFARPSIARRVVGGLDTVAIARSGRAPTGS